MREARVSDRDSQRDHARIWGGALARRVLHDARSSRSKKARAMDVRTRRRRPRWAAAAPVCRHAGGFESAAHLSQDAARTVGRPRRDFERIMTPPRLADWILSRVLPMGKRGDSIRGDLVEEFHQQQSQVWYWQQTMRLTLRYLFSPSPQDKLTYPRSSGMWFDLASDVKSAFRNIRRAPGTSALIVLTLAFAIGAATIGFTFADVALLRGLPVGDPSKVVSVFANDQQGTNPRARISGPDFLDFVPRRTTLEEMS